MGGHRAGPFHQPEQGDEVRATARPMPATATAKAARTVPDTARNVSDSAAWTPIVQRSRTVSSAVPGRATVSKPATELVTERMAEAMTVVGSGLILGQALAAAAAGPLAAAYGYRAAFAVSCAAAAASTALALALAATRPACFRPGPA
ncbi:hypothetical protein AB0D46_20300 [Streptomyces sp. NPDC048383]|uniref:hypothetical protein n=1 Tax=Streptomyces sp. NPDC048383 TaxID=3155386 RepID=UPI003429C4DA